MPHKPNPNDRFINQARTAYTGDPKRIARCTDQYGEIHVVIEMRTHRGKTYYLDWIGAEHAEHPDEWGDELPFTNLKWTYLPDTKETAQ